MLLMLLSFGSGSAYCGGLWLAAVGMMCKMAEVLGDAKTQQRYTDILSKGKEAFERMLWNGGCSPAGSQAWLHVLWEGSGSAVGDGALQKVGEGGKMPSLQAPGR